MFDRPGPRYGHPPGPHDRPGPPDNRTHRPHDRPNRPWIGGRGAFLGGWWGRQIATNVFIPGQGGFPSGGGGGTDLSETVLNAALRLGWEQSSGQVDTIVVNGFQKRRINAFASTLRAYQPEDVKFRDLVGVYESDFGVCRVILSRWCPADTVLLLDSSRIEVLPLRGRSFQYKPMGVTGDAAHGQVLGEYTVEFRNENAHAAIKGLSIT